MHLKLNRILFPVYNLGPGKRIGIWVQGCSLHCAGCISPHLWTTEDGTAVDIVQLTTWVQERAQHFDGITLTGGEPFDQYKALVAFCALLKETSSLSVFVYSGYTLEELRTHHPDRAFMRFIDYVLDGRYRRGMHEGGDRGSTNQSLYALREGRATRQHRVPHGNIWSVAATDGQAFLSGIPREHDLATLEQTLRKAGIELALGGSPHGRATAENERNNQPQGEQ